MREFQRRQIEAYTIKEEEEERVRIAAKLERERQEEERAAAEEAEHQRRADEAAAQLETLCAQREAQIRARAQAEYQLRLEGHAQLRTSESFDSGYGSVGDGAEREAERKVDHEVNCEAVEAEDKENIAVRRSYACYDESDSEVEAAEVKVAILSPDLSLPEPDDNPTVHT